MSKNRSWCFTLNNYTGKEEQAIQNSKYKYLLYGYEKGESGTIHLQGYITLTSPSTLSALKKRNGFERMHLEVAKGNFTQNFKYCTKEGDYKEFGERPKMGERNDLKSIKDMVLEKTPMKNIALQCENFQQIKYAETLYKYTEEKRNWKSYVYWFYGGTGSGKSRCAMESYPDAYWCMDTSRWFDGYDAHKTIVS